MGLFRRNKNNNKPVIRQIIDLIPSHLLIKVTQQHGSDKGCHKYKTYDQLVALLFGQLCRCSTLEDISVGIGASKTYIRDLGLQQSPAKSTMSDGNKKRDFKVFESLYMNLLTYYGHLLKQNNLRQVIEETKPYLFVTVVQLAYVWSFLIGQSFGQLKEALKFTRSGMKQ